MAKAQQKRVRTRWDRTPVHPEIGGPGLTEQHHARACDINTIMAKYVKTGVIEHIKRYEPTFGDVSETDFSKSMQVVAQVCSEFEELPAFARDHYGTPEKYLEAVSSPEGLEELRSLRPKGDRYDQDGSPKKPSQEPSESPEAPENAQSAQKSDPEA